MGIVGAPGISADDMCRIVAATLVPSTSDPSSSLCVVHQLESSHDIQRWLRTLASHGTQQCVIIASHPLSVCEACLSDGNKFARSVLSMAQLLHEGRLPNYVMFLKYCNPLLANDIFDHRYGWSAHKLRAPLFFLAHQSDRTRHACNNVDNIRSEMQELTLEEPWPVGEFWAPLTEATAIACLQRVGYTSEHDLTPDMVKCAMVSLALYLRKSEKDERTSEADGSLARLLDHFSLLSQRENNLQLQLSTPRQVVPVPPALSLRPASNATTEQDPLGTGSDIAAGLGEATTGIATTTTTHDLSGDNPPAAPLTSFDTSMDSPRRLSGIQQHSGRLADLGGSASPQRLSSFSQFLPPSPGGMAFAQVQHQHQQQHSPLGLFGGGSASRSVSVTYNDMQFTSDMQLDYDFSTNTQRMRSAMYSGSPSRSLMFNEMTFMPLGAQPQQPSPPRVQQHQHQLPPNNMLHSPVQPRALTQHSYDDALAAHALRSLSHGGTNTSPTPPVPPTIQQQQHTVTRAGQFFPPVTQTPTPAAAQHQSFLLESPSQPNRHLTSTSALGTNSDEVSPAAPHMQPMQLIAPVTSGSPTVCVGRAIDLVSLRPAEKLIPEGREAFAAWMHQQRQIA